MKPTIKVKKLANYDPTFAELKYETPHSSGFDLKACLPNGNDIVLTAGETRLIPTGLAFELPKVIDEEAEFDYVKSEIQIRARSGLSLKTNLRIPNSPATIDQDYTGEIQVIVQNIGQTLLTIKHGERIAQAVLAPVLQARFKYVEELAETERGSNGFGSSGRF